MLSASFVWLFYIFSPGCVVNGDVATVSRERAGDKYYWRDFGGQCELRNCSEATPTLVGDGICLGDITLRRQCELANNCCSYSDDFVL